MISVAFLILLFVFLFQNTGGAPSVNKSEYLIRHYDIDDGLPVNAVNGIKQDADGYLYFSTYDGLVRYDGYDFEVYNTGNTPGMLTNRLAGMLKASDNTLWLFNEGGTITSKKGTVFRTYAIPELPGEATRLIENDDGRIWVGGTNGLSYFSQKESAFIPVDFPALQSGINVLVSGVRSGVYVLTNDGIYSIEGNAMSLLLAKEDFSIPASDIRDIQYISENKLWIIGISGAFQFNMNEKKIERTVERTSSQLNFSATTKQQNGAHVLTTNSGFYLLGDGDKSYQKLNIPFSPAEFDLSISIKGKQGEQILIGNKKVIIENQIVLEGPSPQYVMVDKEGSLWVGTRASGLYQIRKSSFTNISPKQIPGFINIYSIVEDKEKDIWACSFTNGIYRLQQDGFKNWNSTNSKLVNNFCKLVYEDEDSTIYASTNGQGLWKFVANEWNYIEALDPLFEGHSRSIEAMHRKGNQLYISSFNSLIVFENNRYHFFDESRPKELSRIQVFRENSRGIIFAGTDGNGLSRMVGDSFINYSVKKEVLNSNNIRDIYLQSDDTLWVVNESAGLNRIVLDEKGTVLSSKSVTAKEGLSHNSLHRIIDDGLGFFWISGNNGIMRISQKELNAYADGGISELRVLSFDEKDGMINREVGRYSSFRW